MHDSLLNNDNRYIKVTLKSKLIRNCQVAYFERLSRILNLHMIYKTQKNFKRYLVRFCTPKPTYDTEIFFRNIILAPNFNYKIWEYFTKRQNRWEKKTLPEDDKVKSSHPKGCFDELLSLGLESSSQPLSPPGGHNNFLRLLLTLFLYGTTWRSWWM